MALYDMSEQELISEIKNQGKLSEEEIYEKLKQIMEEKQNLISKKGALLVLINEQGIRIKPKEKELKIADIKPGLSNVITYGKVLTKYEMKEFERQDEDELGKVGSFVMADETGSIRVVLWHEQTDFLEKIKEGDIVKMKGCYSKLSGNRIELHAADDSEIEINPSGLKLEKVKEYTTERKKIKDLKEDETNVELIGTIVNLFQPIFYHICPECRKRVREENNFKCDVHGEVKPEVRYMLSIILDDGSGNIRVICFSRQAENLLGGRTKKEMLEFKDLFKFEPVSKHYLGMISKVIGRTRKNTMTNQIEFIAQLIFSDYAPTEEELNAGKENETGHTSDDSKEEEIIVNEK